MTTEQLILQFIEHEFGARTLCAIGNKLSEESGEVNREILKIEDESFNQIHLADEVGDVLIVASQIAAIMDTTLEDLRARRFAFIQQRSENLKSKEP